MQRIHKPKYRTIHLFSLTHAGKQVYTHTPLPTLCPSHSFPHALFYSYGNLPSSQYSPCRLDEFSERQRSLHPSCTAVAMVLLSFLKGLFAFSLVLWDFFLFCFVFTILYFSNVICWKMYLERKASHNDVLLKQVMLGLLKTRRKIMTWKLSLFRSSKQRLYIIGQLWINETA